MGQRAQAPAIVEARGDASGKTWIPLAGVFEDEGGMPAEERVHHRLVLFGFARAGGVHEQAAAADGARGLVDHPGLAGGEHRKIRFAP